MEVLVGNVEQCLENIIIIVSIIKNCIKCIGSEAVSAIFFKNVPANQMDVFVVYNTYPTDCSLGIWHKRQIIRRVCSNPIDIPSGLSHAQRKNRQVYLIKLFDNHGKNHARFFAQKNPTKISSGFVVSTSFSNLIMFLKL